MVAVGNRVYFATNWKTFHDFLRAFIVDKFGAAWFKAESEKPEQERHKIVGWLLRANSDARRLGTLVGDMRVGPMTGAARAFLNLAYNIYLIAHHAHPQKAEGLLGRFIARLKSPQSGDFVGALFETYAAAAFLKAGFNLEYENESTGTGTHVEFVATYPSTGKAFSVEVKSRNREQSEDGDVDDIKRLRVTSKLTKALLKQSEHPRVVMLELNVPDRIDPAEDTGWPAAAMNQIRAAEQLTRPDGRLFDPAYVLVTNHSFHNNLDVVGAQTQAMAAGFRIPDFGHGVQHPGFFAYLQAQERHREMIALMDSLKTHYEIPAAFDVEIPELAFRPDGSPPLLKIGKWYSVPTEDGGEAPGLLEEATVLENEKRAYCIYKMEDGKRSIIGAPLTDEEIAAWKRHPDIFFGKVRSQGRKCESQLQLMESLYETYRSTPREKLLEWMSKAANFEQLKTMPHEQLAATYCERIAVNAWTTRRAATPISVQKTDGG